VTTRGSLLLYGTEPLCSVSQVVSRMEAGDHWIVYGQVLDGQVVNETALSAVHHRKVGNHY
jgi:flavin reductase (DIM6/NTAB) family NADH-FMN oxidoreductase RutF